MNWTRFLTGQRYPDGPGEQGVPQDCSRDWLVQGTSQGTQQVVCGAILAQAAAFRKKVEEDKGKASEALRKQHGLQYDEKLALVSKVNQKFGDDDWIRYLNTGPGNDPSLLRFLIKVGEAISEDTLVRGRAAPMNVEQREAGVLSYPNRPEITGRQRFRSVR